MAGIIFNYSYLKEIFDYNHSESEYYSALRTPLYPGGKAGHRIPSPQFLAA